MKQGREYRIGFPFFIKKIRKRMPLWWSILARKEDKENMGMYYGVIYY
jgi:hypothetical protein